MVIYLLTVVIGAVIGLSSGMFGIGGALLATPMLKLWLGLSAPLALATPLVASIPAAISGSVAYSRSKLIRFDIAGRALVLAIPANILGAYVTKYTSDLVLMVATGIVLAYTAVTFIQRGYGKGKGGDEAPQQEQRFGPMAYAAGALAGFTSGFLAIGGGMVMVPALVKIIRLPTKQAVATSLLCVAALAVPAVIVHGLLHHIDWNVALVLSIAVVPMSYLGAKLATAMKNSTLERIYGTVMLAFALYFIYKNLNL